MSEQDFQDLWDSSIRLQLDVGYRRTDRKNWTRIVRMYSIG